MTKEFVHISRGISKLASGTTVIPSVNLPPVETCREDAPCFKKCYARKGRFSFSHNQELLQQNLGLWNTDPKKYEADIMFAAFHSRFFRWHSSGDIPDYEYLKMMVRIARALPHTSFLCFTKKDYLINVYLFTEETAFPENLTIVLSAWGEWLPDNPHNLPVAYVRFRKKDPDMVPPSARKCPKFCGDCTMTGCSCWDLKAGESVVFDEH